jgi:GNAT superfamily N-acetyltransferase
MTFNGIVRRLRALTPRIQSAFIVYLVPGGNPVTELDPDVDVVEVTTPDDPLLDEVAVGWQRPRARKELARRGWDIVVAIKDGQPVGRIWETWVDERALFSGVPRVRLAEDECLMFDLYVAREHRRGNVAMTMAHHFFEKYDPDGGSKIRYVYGFISYENAPSILWHHSIGFNVVQTMNYLQIGERIKWKVPFSDVPRFGPMSRRGRHTEPGVELFGTQLLPQ